MNSTKDIFVTIDELEENIPTSISKDEILRSIPKNALKKSDNNLSQTKTEWRWRIFKFPNKKSDVIEISFKKPSDKRMYINGNGTWVYREIDTQLDQFVVDEFYTYNE
jgi:hypothetical protein